MIYIMLKNGQTFTDKEGKNTIALGDIAEVYADENEQELRSICFDVNDSFVPISEIDVIKAIKNKYPNAGITFLNENAVMLSDKKKKNSKTKKSIVTIIVCIWLFLGSGMAITYFHTDVDMKAAHQSIYKFVTGVEKEKSLWAIIPYCIGVGLGGYLFLRPNANISPLDLKTEGKRKDNTIYEIGRIKKQKGDQ